MSKAITVVTSPDLTLYAFPQSGSLANWSTLRVALTQAATPNKGRYTATVDETVDTTWLIFSGASQPANHAANIGHYLIDTASSGGGSTGDILPLASYVEPRVRETKIKVFIDESLTIEPALFDEENNPVSLLGLTLKFVVEDAAGTNLANLTPTITGTNHNQFVVTLPSTVAAKPGREMSWALRVVGTAIVKGYGPIEAKYAPRIPA